MTTSDPRASYAAILAAVEPSARAFDEDTRDPEAAQLRRLRAQRRLFGGRQLDRLRQLQEAAPLSTYDDVAADVERMARGARDGLRGMRALWLETTGGSTGSRRMVPVTAAFLEEMSAGLSPWLRSLFTSVPGVTSGCAYWSISPLGRGAPSSSGGVPHGAASDVAYFPEPLRRHLRDVLAAPAELALVDDIAACRYLTALLLLARADLAFISVWSPTFLSVLLSFLERNAAGLVDDLAVGRARRAGLPSSLTAALGLLPDRRRAREVARCLDLPVERRYRALWPRLSLLSMWTDAGAAPFVEAVRRLFPGVVVEPKGLLATEGVVTVPIAGAPAPVLAVGSHVYEFLPEDGGVPRFAHELERGRVYEVVLTTGAGLVRYRLRDRVRVEGLYRATPCLRFLGRGGDVADLVGEKLCAEDVQRAIATAATEAGVDTVFALLAPVVEEGAAPRYRLYLESDADDARLAALARALEAALCSAHPYRYARALEQLGPLDVLRVSRAAERYERRCIERGQRAGDIKPAVLRAERDWDAAFSAPIDGAQSGGRA